MFKITQFKTYLLVEFTTDVTFDAIIAAIQSVTKKADYKDLNDIFVFGGLPAFLNFEQLDAIVNAIERSYPEDATRSKTALVISSGFGKALAEIWINLADRLPYQIDIFENLEDAQKWIQSDRKA